MYGESIRLRGLNERTEECHSLLEKLTAKAIQTQHAEPMIADKTSKAKSPGICTPKATVIYQSSTAYVHLKMLKNTLIPDFVNESISVACA